MLDITELYEFYILDGFLEPQYCLFLNNTINTINIDGKTYYPYPIERSNISKDIETGDRVRVSLFYYEALLKKLHRKISYYLGLNLYFLIDNEIDEIYKKRVFSGFARNYQIQNYFIVFEFVDLTQFISKKFPKFYTSINCCCSFGDKYCNINRNNYKICMNIEQNKSNLDIFSISNRIKIKLK